jgi:hypothetical protein
MVVGSGTSLLGGATVTGTERFTVVIDPDTALEEIVDVSSVSTNTLTIVRGIEVGGTGQAHSAGAVVRHMAIGRDYREANLHIEATAAYNDGTATHDLHGIASGEGDVVGTDKAQTLTAKTLTSPKINENVVLTATSTELNILDGVTASAAELNILDGVTASAAELNILDGVTASAAELNILDGATLSVTELNYVDGVTSAIQTQIDAKAPIASPTFTGTVTLPTSTVTSAMITDGTIVNADINASAGITYGKLSLTGGIVNTDIANGAAISLGKLASDPLARANHTGTQTASTISDFDTQVRTSRLDQMAAPTGSVSVNSQKITSLATPTADTDASTKLYVDTSINNLIDGAPSTLDTLNEIAAALADTANFSDTVVLKAGSTMTGALTLSGAPTVDLHAATKLYVDAVAGSATAAASSATAAEAAYDSFDDRYLGPKSSPPSLDNDGNALITGALYWNSVSNEMFAWTGSAWGSISSTAAIFRYKFTAAGGETSESGLDDNGVTLSYIAGKEQVYLNGVLLVRGTDYTASNGTSIASLAALTAGDILEIITFTAFDLATSISNTLFDAKGDILVATAADTPGKLTAGIDGYVLKANSGTATGLEWAAVDAVPLTTIDAKGDLIVGSADNTVVKLTAGANGLYLAANSGTASGLVWTTIPSSPSTYSSYIASGSIGGNFTVTASFPSGVYNIAFSNVSRTNVGSISAITSGIYYNSTTAASATFTAFGPWTLRTAFSANDNNAITFGNSTFVSGGIGGVLATSTDGTTWTTRTSTFGASNIFALTFGNGVYVAGGDGGTLRTSTNGTTWTSRTSTFGSSTISALTYGTVYVAGGAAGTLRTSTDGITWTSRTSTFGVSSIYSLTYGTVYVAGGENATLRTSTDGITWTSRTSGFGSNDINALTYGSGVYVAGGDSGTLRTSTDGITWTARTSNCGSNDINGAIFGNNLFAIGGANDAGSSSTDGITWSSRNFNHPGNSIKCFSFGVNTFIATGGSGRITTSANNTEGVLSADSFISWNPTSNLSAV